MRCYKVHLLGAHGGHTSYMVDTQLAQMRSYKVHLLGAHGGHTSYLVDTQLAQMRSYKVRHPIYHLPSKHTLPLSGFSFTQPPLALPPVILPSSPDPIDALR